MGTGRHVVAVAVSAEQVGGHRQELEVGRLERRLLVSGRQSGERVSPCLPGVGISATFELVPLPYTGLPHQFFARLALARALTIDRSDRKATIATAPAIATMRFTSTAGCHVTSPLLIT